MQTLVRCCLTRSQMESMYSTLQQHMGLPPPMLRSARARGMHADAVLDDCCRSNSVYGLVELPMSRCGRCHAY